MQLFVCIDMQSILLIQIIELYLMILVVGTTIEKRFIFLFLLLILKNVMEIKINT